MTIPSSEQLLLPLLKLLAAGGGQRTLSWAIREFARTAPLSAAERQELETDFSMSPLSRNVGGAWQLLESAGLTERASHPRGRRISAQGREVLRTNPLSLSIAFLKQFPEFLEARERGYRELQARAFRDLRLEHYSAGRRLLSEGTFSAGALLLSYAIEMALKAGLHTVEAKWLARHKKLVGYSHDLVDLYQSARDLGVFEDTSISPEFLEYATDHFSRRYPSGDRKLAQKRGGWAIGGHKLATYDDCICQLDNSLEQLNGNPSVSLVFAALTDALKWYFAELLFADNPFALTIARRFIGEPGQPVPSGSYLARLRAEPERERRFRAAAAADDPRAALFLAALYRYPRRGQPDPDPILNSRSSWRDSQHRELGWILKRLREAFGATNVRLEELRRPRGFLTLFVFDRRAEQFWHELGLGVPIGDLSYSLRTQERPDTKAALEEWIAKVQREFAEGR